ncbi:MAG TPA: phosphoribosylaminoimidazolesuccinocarboxamide synthase [Burkholderiales bacterium]|nr:phosphoribosylaminoimidazolesuccinocarboxamide synthase [Burkholderiales bacterium]
MANVNTDAILETNLQSLKFLHRGKVRDLYAVGDDKLLVVQTDRLSAFDVVLPTPIQGKGRVLTELSNFWFKKLGHVIPNHVTGIAPESVVSEADRPQVTGRSMVVKKLQPLLVEAVVRGYLIGSGWSDYKKTGAVCGIKLPQGLQQAQKLPQVLFTPSSKAPAGQHDENITYADVEKIVGVKLAAQVRDVSIRLYAEAADFAAARGVIIADTKFEFGVDASNSLVLIDEILTPDSSRFWPAAEYRTGISPPSFDKQIIRDWLETTSWDKKPPAPAPTPEVLAKTAEKYREVQRLLTR